MVGDDGAEADGMEGLAFLDRWMVLARAGPNPKKLLTKRAIDAGAGVGRVTKFGKEGCIDFEDDVVDIGSNL